MPEHRRRLPSVQGPVLGGEHSAMAAPACWRPWTFLKQGCERTEGQASLAVLVPLIFVLGSLARSPTLPCQRDRFGVQRERPSTACQLGDPGAAHSDVATMSAASDWGRLTCCHAWWNSTKLDRCKQKTDATDHMHLSSSWRVCAHNSGLHQRTRCAPR